MLSDVRIRNAKKGKTRYRLYDGGGLGPCLEVAVSGSRFWRVKYVRQGRQTYRILGSWPLTSLKEAREKAAEFRKALEPGWDPSAGKKGGLGPVLRQAAEAWAARFLPPLALRSAKRHRCYLDRIALPALGDVPVEALTPQAVLNQVLRPAEATGHIGTPHRVKSLLSLIFRFAVAKGAMERDFTLDLRGALPSAPRGHMAPVSGTASLGGVLRAMDSYGGTPTVASSAIHLNRHLPTGFHENRLCPQREEPSCQGSRRQLPRPGEGGCRLEGRVR
jgi:hypothetical protein